MIDLPGGFPMYCIDLKQEFDSLIENTKKIRFPEIQNTTFETKEDIKKFYKYHHKYPKQTNEHNALADARWSKELYEFLMSI